MTEGWRHFPYGELRAFHDADTLAVLVQSTYEMDFGFDFTATLILRHPISVRLYGISAPEVRGDEAPLGALALHTAQELVEGAAVCELWTWKQSFTRYVARVVVGGRYDLARTLIAIGCGRAWDGKTERPDPRAKVDLDEEAALYDRLLARDFGDPTGKTP